MYEISAEEYEKIIQARKANKNKRVEKWLEVLCLRYEGKKSAEIAERTGYNQKYLPYIIARYKEQGLEEFIRIKHTSHNRKLTHEEEAEILSSFEKSAQDGKIVTTEEIRKAFNERLGEETVENYVTRLLKRHGWRKVMPRPKHPKAASQEEQDSSKKLKGYREN